MTLYAVCRATVDLSKSITDHYVALFYRGGGGRRKEGGALHNYLALPQNVILKDKNMP